jgi:hypothetical protein
MTPPLPAPDHRERRQHRQRRERLIIAKVAHAAKPQRDDPRWPHYRSTCVNMSNGVGDWEAGKGSASIARVGIGGEAR